jgi:hypothetical protein
MSPFLIKDLTHLLGITHMKITIKRRPCFLLATSIGVWLKRPFRGWEWLCLMPDGRTKLPDPSVRMGGNSGLPVPRGILQSSPTLLRPIKGLCHEIKTCFSPVRPHEYYPKGFEHAFNFIDICIRLLGRPTGEHKWKHTRSDKFRKCYSTKCRRG